MKNIDLLVQNGDIDMSRIQGLNIKRVEFRNVFVVQRFKGKNVTWSGEVPINHVRVWYDVVSS